MTERRELIEFAWETLPAGFVWRDIEDPPAEGEASASSRYLVPSPSESGPRFRRYYPLRTHPLLYRAFAEIPSPVTEEAVLDFTAQFGWLAGSLAFNDLPRGSSIPTFLPAERLEDWEGEISSMRECVRVWDALLHRDVAVLGEYKSHWAQEDEAIDRLLGPSSAMHLLLPEPLRELGSVSQGLNQTSPVPGFSVSGFHFTATMYDDSGDSAQFDANVENVALAHIIGRINAELRENAAPSLIYSASDDRAILRIVPQNLLGAMWLQFARAIDGGKAYARCEVCGDLWEVAPDSDYSPEARGVHRSNKRYCSDKCRSKALRVRQQRARELHAEGRPPAEIAKELGSDERTVDGWIRKNRGSR